MVASLAIGWVIGVVVGCLLPGPLGPWPAIVALLLGVSLTLAGEELSARGWNVPLAFGAVAAGIAVGPPPAPPPIPDGLARLVARVEEVRHGVTGAEATLRVEEGRRIEDGRPLPRGALVRIRGVDAPPWSRLSLVARLYRSRPFRNLTPHPPWPRPAPLAGSGRLPTGATPQRLEGSPARAGLYRARRHVRASLERTLPPRSRGVAMALVLGESRAVAPATRSAVAGAGLSHLLAVSGLHVALVAGILVALLGRALAWTGRVGHPARAAAVVGVPLALGFAAFAGGAPSAWRAAVTASLGWALAAAGRRPRTTEVAGGACLLLSLGSPRAVLAPGFLLSILATAALVTGRAGGPDILPASIHGAVRASARATLATAPLVLWCFGGVPLVGLVANVLLLPVGAAVLVPLVVTHALCASLTPDLAGPTAVVFDRTAWAFVAACDALSQLSWARALPPPSLPQGLLVTGTCLALLVLRRPARRALAVAVTCALLALFEADLRRAERPHGRLRVSVLDVGQGDSTLLDMPDGSLVVVDGGGGLPDPGASVLVPLLRARRRDHVDLLVLSHPHPDHYGGLRTLTETLPVGEVWDSGQAEGERGIVDDHREAAAWLGSLRTRGVRVRTADALCGVGRRFGPARIDVLWPCPAFDSGHGPNDNSLVLRITYGEHHILLAGDAEAHAEASLAAGGRPLRADVLKVGHHGSRTSSTAAFLSRVEPRLALVSCGIANRYGHPHAEALARLQAAGATVLRTDREGGVSVTSDGHALRVATWSGRELRLSSRGASSRGRPPASR